ncbi:fimbria/pilus outer membrane usher protein [Aeromonas veronii]|uniref:fimbria/pilus outer membrane usher protein n=1 Tax=Aeromonas veronii TaxID=654 RepID=UPI0035BB10DF
MLALYVFRCLSIYVVCSGLSFSAEFEFNTDLLDINSRADIASGLFNKSGYILPGSYLMQVKVNDISLGERRVEFKKNSHGESDFCLAHELSLELGLKQSELAKLTATENDEGCYDLRVLDGLMVRGELSKDTLFISVPQGYRDYVNEYWDPPTRWEEGIGGVILDYGINIQHGRWSHDRQQLTNLSSYGVGGANLGAWRLRADWQARHEQGGEVAGAYSEAQLSRVYAYRALPAWSSQLQVGELDSGSSLFESFGFTGASLVTDERMLPPNLRGYAPEVVGVAKTNAKVVVSQQGRVIYETQVAAGPFRIQELSNGITGVLDVRVEGVDGTAQQFQVNTATIPYLARPGSLRYRVYGGKVALDRHQFDGPLFASGEFSWGIDNGKSLFGGALLGDGYNALALGIGRDLLYLGAISFDVTTSRAELLQERKSGESYRINYSKNFDVYDSQITFAGYRFSEHDFMTMSDFISAKEQGGHYGGGSKEMYKVLLSSQFRDANLGLYLDYTYQSYWNQRHSEYASVSVSHYFDLMEWHGLNASLTAYRNTQDNQADDGLYFSLSMPFGLGKSLSYNAANISGKASHNVGFRDMADERNSYSLTASTSPQGEGISGFYTHEGSKSTVMANASYQPDSRSLGLSMTGGITATAQGSALHPVGMMGGTRILVDTDGVADVPLQSAGHVTASNSSGKAVIADITSYYRQRTMINVDLLGEDAEPVGTPITAGTLTEGAIGYRNFDMLSGAKRMVEIRTTNNNPLPFAAEVRNAKQQQIGMLADDGIGYLTGLHGGEELTVSWGEQQCQTRLPARLPAESVLVSLVCQ